jgi:hypothetical protein
MKEVDWNKVSEFVEVIELVKKLQELKHEIRKLDDKALMRY